ncbi:MAG TPA: glycosyltransferase family 4 protein [Patescibacteria group bacterium]|nr:glycosyltransferase family 4 protein [Patescibacteria group bacterium]
MRILAFFFNGCECGKFIGGSERRFFEVSKRMKNLGADVLALEYESLNSWRYGQIGYSPVRVKKRSRHAILDCLKQVVLGSIVCTQNKCDIIYVTEPWPWNDTPWSALVAPYLVSILCRKPLAIVFHHIAREDLTKTNRIMRMAIRRGIWIAVSKATANDVVRHFGPKIVSVVGNGINLSSSDNSERHAKRYDSVFLGRIAEDKGVFELLQAWRIVMKKIPLAQLLLIGGIDKGLKNRILNLIKQARIDANVHISGYVSDDEMVQLLESSKIFVLPSHEEGFSLSAAEAMAVGLPCILSDLPALRETYSGNAVFVPSRNVDKLAESILHLLENAQQQEELREKGKKLAKCFSWEKVAEKELAVLEKACGDALQ